MLFGFLAARTLKYQARRGLSSYRAMASASSVLKAKALVFEKNGEPMDVLKLQEQDVRDPGEHELLLRFLKAPINPSDINTIQGKYPVKLTMPATPGFEGVAEVLQTGSKVTGFQAGDKVVPVERGIGTWRTYGTCEARGFMPVPRELPVDAAATLCINPPTALAMLESFADLRPGDTVVQNGATSAVGQAVIQLARAKGLKTFNIIRSRPNLQETVDWLKSMGADMVVSEEEVDGFLKQMKAEKGSGEVGKLGLNCVGGKAATSVAKALCPGTTMVTYGGMSMQPVSLPTSLLIFKDITFKGFWLSGWYSQAQGSEGYQDILQRVAQYYIDGKLTCRTTSVPMADFQTAIAQCASSFRHAKVLLSMT